MSKITVTTIAGATSGADANTVKIESGDALNVVSGDLIVDTSVLKVDASNNRVGVGTASPAQPLHVVGGAVQFQNTQSTYLQVNTSDTHLYTAGAHPLRFGTNSIERMRIDADGLKFNGDTAAANALDDYEEGDFTPTLSPGSGSYNGLTLTGKYTKVGRLVSVQMNLTITASGNASGSATVSNLPFASVGSWNRMPNKWRENQATGVCGQFVMNHGSTSGFMQNDDGTNIAHTTGRVYLINAMYYSA